MASYDVLAPYEQYIQASAKKYGISPDEIKAIIMQESGGKADASNSKSSALGLMQLTKAHGLTREQLLDPATNIDAGAAYYAANKKAFGGDTKKALIGYHEGTAAAKQIFAGKRQISEEGGNYVNSPNFTVLYNDQEKKFNPGNPVAGLKTAPKALQGEALLTAAPQTQEQATSNASQGALMGADAQAQKEAQSQADSRAEAERVYQETQNQLEEQRKRKALAEQQARDSMYGEAIASAEGLLASLSNPTQTESHTEFTHFYKPQWGAPTDQALGVISNFGTMRNMMGS